MLHPIVNRKMEIKATLWCPFPFIRLANIRKTNYYECWGRCGELSAFIHYLCRCEFLQLFLEIKKNTNLLTQRSFLWNFIPWKCWQLFIKIFAQNVVAVLFSFAGNKTTGNNLSPNQSGNGWANCDRFIHTVELCTVSLDLVGFFLQHMAKGQKQVAEKCI